MTRHDVATYYDHNTRRFLRLGGAPASLSIHRQLWGKGIATRRAAAAHIDVLLGDALEQAGFTRPTVIDFGCGVGGTVFALAARLPSSRLHGITISSTQHALAIEHAAERGLTDRCRFVLGDFEQADLGVEADAIVAVESFAHSASPSRFFVNAARHLSMHGHLIVVDDFLNRDAADLAPADRRIVDAFRRGWRVPSVMTVEAAVRSASEAQLRCVEQRDLTGLVRLDQTRERLVATLAPVLDALGLARSPLFANLIGGGALHRGLGLGLLGYRWLRFEHAGAMPAARRP